jgi:hypothetical protein
LKKSTWENLAFVLAMVAAAVAAAAVAAVAVAAVAVAAVAAAVGVVAVVAAVWENPKLSCVISSVVICLCAVSFFFTLPTALNPPQTIEVICQVTTTQSPVILIHNSTTVTITGQSIVNQTMTEIASKVSCP